MSSTKASNVVVFDKVAEPGAVQSPPVDALTPIALVLLAAVLATIAGSRLVNRLEPTELLRDE